MPTASTSSAPSRDVFGETPECPDSGIPAGSVPGAGPARLEGLSIVLPCLDEAENIAAAVAAARRSARRVARDYEIVVVDDGSTDETAAVVTRLVESDPRVRLLVHVTNRGYGSALRTGIEAARMPWVFLTDADLQFDLAELEDFLPLADRADLLVGWRIMRRDPLNRRLNAAAWNWLVRRTFRIPVRDVDCAFKLARRDLLERCALQSSGAMISTELVVRALGLGARLEELGVHHHPRSAGRATGARPAVVLRALRELLALRGTLRSALA